jgi:ketosteroid isomerase-like protein
MYKAAVRKLIRRNIGRLNHGDYAPALAMFGAGATLNFPGESSWASQYRTPRPSRAPSGSHQGRDEIEGFLRRYVETGIQMEVEDILVNGPPWNMRAAARVHHGIIDAAGTEIYANRAILFVRARWGKIFEQEDYEDTVRVIAFDARTNGDPADRSTA